MKRLVTKNKSIYDEYMDKECLELCDAMNALPGIRTIESCCGHSGSPFSIFFRVVEDNNKGLFFLTRCVDRRYWKYGYLWKIELGVGDMFYNTKNPSEVPYSSDAIPNELPIEYRLFSGPIVGEDAYAQAKSLVENMNYHINHENFMRGYDLDVNDFETEEITQTI